MADRPAPAGETPPEKEIKVTPEMIEAGLGAFCAYDSRFDLEEDAVKKIFDAMIAVSR